MWFNNNSNSGVKYIKIMWLKKEEPTHYFSLNWEKIPEMNFSWKLIKIQNSEYEYEWMIRQTFKLLFIDNIKDYYQLDIAINSLSRGLINSILWTMDNYVKRGINQGEINMDLSLYINKDWYKQIWIKINWDRATWRYSVEEQKKHIETIVKKNWTKENDYYEYDNLLREWIDEITSFIVNNEEIFMDNIEIETEENNEGTIEELNNILINNK